MENQSTHASRALLGAALGAGFVFLFMTKGGQLFLDSIEPWLDDLIRDMQRLRRAETKVREAVDEGRRTFAGVSKLGIFGNPSDNWSAETRH